MPITIHEQHLLALLRECLPVLEFARGGCNCEDVTAKVRFVLELAGQQARDPRRPRLQAIGAMRLWGRIKNATETWDPPGN